MRILAFSDIHNDWHQLRSLTQEDADIYICAGDLTFGERGLETAADILLPINDLLYIVPGNNERPDHLEEFFRHVIHGRVENVKGIRIGGIGGSPRTPFNTLFEWDEDYAYKILERLGKTDIFVSHTPPKGTELARTMSGHDAGSEAVRWYIEEYQPRVAIVGHVHERAGSETWIGETVVVNPGLRGKLFHFSP
ncbi:MAG: uncharacterized protein PWP76_219 [Candidatus Diapherotrites archaeon]|nr:uncharacterized protein [Candidatus Diapherotrites archaeon]MDN5367251.1 uncharacterized protein [Candidatus Diapherotrites archaeon]